MEGYKMKKVKIKDANDNVKKRFVSKPTFSHCHFQIQLHFRITYTLSIFATLNQASRMILLFFSPPISSTLR